MKPLFRPYFSVVALVMLFLAGFAPGAASGQTFNFKSREASVKHTASQIKSHNGFNDTLIVSHDRWDEMVSANTSWYNYLKFKSVQSYVRFSVNHRYGFKIFQPYTLRLTYNVYGFNNPQTPNVASAMYTDTLTISYKPDSLAAFQDKQFKKYGGLHKMMVVLTGLYKIDGANGVPQWQNLSANGNFDLLNFDVEAAVVVQPYDKKVPDQGTFRDAYGDGGTLAIKNFSDQNGYLPVLWKLNGMALDLTSLKLNPAKYELEWTYIDDYKVNPADSSLTSISPSSLQYNFNDNATRVWLDTNYYRIPLTYQRGYVVYRVRMVRPDSTVYNYPIYGPWTIGATGTVGNLGTDSRYTIGTGHLSDNQNWQYTVSFAEQGKYKQVMSYYDGMLKNRQSITRFNSRPDKLIATEQIYDYEGRPSISILPTPVTTPLFSYQLNLALNQYTGLPYRPSDFDAIQLSVCPADVLLPPLADNSLADIYYSPNNPDQADFQKFVPDAGGFPLVQTIYSPGYNDRVEKQGGAGDSLQIGHNHTAKNDYTGTEQTDMNRLFGTNAGWAGYYRKTVSRDPNGQLSINVTDYRGKTMMSSMVGLPDTSIHALVSNENLADTSLYSEDFLAGTTQQIMGNHRTLDKLFFNEAAGNNIAQYIATVTPFQTFCPGKYLTVSSTYDYSIFDECGILKAHDAGTLGSTGVTTNPSPVSASSSPLAFYMEKGKHSLHKDLTVSADEVGKAVKEFMSLPASENCLHTEPWFIKQSVLSKQFPCPDNFINYDCPSCGSKKYEMIQELWPNHDSTYIKRKYGIYRIINGVVVGNNNSDFTLLCGHGSDPRHWTEPYDDNRIDRGQNGGGEGNPGGGIFIGNWQTAVVSLGGVTVPHGPFIVLNNTDTLHCKYRYQDECVVNMPASVTKYGVTYTNLAQIPVQDFINIFNDTIAEALLPLHPEYCSLLECVDDDYKKRVDKIPDSRIANQLSLLMLEDLINADPLYPVMQADPLAFPNAFDSLAYTTGGYLCLDTIAFNEAYCKSSDGSMLTECQSGMFQAEIASGQLINKYVREKYFQSIKNVYFANRKRFLYLLNPNYNGGGPCSICQPIRMQLVPEPVFPNTDSIYANLLEDFYSTVSNAGSSSSATSGNPSLVNQYFEVVNGVNLDTLQGYADSALNVYINTNNILMQGMLDSMMAKFANCVNGNLTLVRAYLDNLYHQGQAYNMTFTPAQVEAALNAGGMSIDDLCNPYIVNYDNLLDYTQDNGSGIKCGSISFFDDMTSFFNNPFSTPLAALQNIGTPYAISFPSGNQFSQALSAKLGGAGTCSVLASYDATAHLYTLEYASGIQSVKLFFKADNLTGCQYPFAPSGGPITFKVYCTKEAFNAFPSGYVGAYTFALGVTRGQTECRLKAWNDKIVLNNLGENPISTCVPCTQMKTLYQQFWSTAATYGVTNANHPYYNIMLRNFLNYKLKRVFTDDQYHTFIESCAIMRDNATPQFIGTATVVFPLNGSQAFVNASDQQFPFPVPMVWRIQYGPTNRDEIRFDLKQLPVSYLRTYINFIKTYCSNNGLSYTVNTDPDIATGNTLMGFVVSEQQYPQFNSSIFNGAPVYLTMSLAGTSQFNVWNGTSFVPRWIYALYTTNASNLKGTVEAVNTMKHFIDNSGLNAEYIPKLGAALGDEYSLPEKQAYLDYVYQFQNLPPNKVLDTIAGMPGTYGHVAMPGNIQNYYYPGTLPGGPYPEHYDMLDNALMYANSYLGGTFFFTGSDTRNIPMGNGEMLTAYRCGDSTFWYRYFGPGDTLYNVFMKPPSYIDTALLPGYTSPGGADVNLGEGLSRSFRLTPYNAAAPAQSFVLNGFTDFTIGSNGMLHDVLLAHAANESIAVADTSNNCERQLLLSAIYEGKVKYKLYIDSIKTKLYNDFYAYIMNSGINENLFISYRNQRFNYTLYNYDRAGNLVATIPPAGVSPLANTASVDVSRTNYPWVEITPSYNKKSTYKYNTLNQVAHQETPDGGKTDFFYDAAGRVIFSQNDKQRPSGDMSYTLYDKQGRIIETGQSRIACPYFTPIQNTTATTAGPSCSYYDAVNHTTTPYPAIVTDLLNKTNDEVLAFVRAHDRQEVVVTHYDTACLVVTNRPGFAPQENLRKRVATIKYFDAVSPSDVYYSGYNYAMHFSYDIAGNVKTLTRDYPAYKSISQDLKRVDYDYDVISGKVNLLSYNRSFADQFFQRYKYDADNRITVVETSNDGIIWQQDASYEYYQHGPLARAELGDLNVQGVDYAYTIQGWLKAINGDQLAVDKEMGQDGNNVTPGNPNNAFANDGVALSLNYFKGDYKPIGSTPVTHLDETGKSLYNGNIPRATTSIIPFPDLKSQYTYDQLNRIVRSDYAYMNRANAQLTNTADYYSSYAYDPDGNLKKLVRKGNNPSSPVMDSLNYHYSGYLNYSTVNNRLQNVTDFAPNAYSNDIKQYMNQNTSRYTYDATGNVTQDLVSGQDMIDWTHYNKVSNTFNSQQNQTLGFEYDGAGNRYLKGLSNGSSEHQAGDINNDYYVRDAQGNILAVYKDEGNYTMERQQWIEYITASMWRLCDRRVILDRYYGPFYLFNSHFKASLFRELNANDSWKAQYLAQVPVSEYLKDPTVLSAVLGGTYNTNTLFSELSTATADNGISFLGTATNNLLTDPGLRRQFMNALSTPAESSSSEETGSSFLKLLCALAPDVMGNAMGDYGISPENDCDKRVDQLSDFLRSSGTTYDNFSREIDFIGNNKYPAQYQAFITALNAQNTELINDDYKQAGNNMALLCQNAPDLFWNVMNSIGIKPEGKCEKDVSALYDAFLATPGALSGFWSNLNKFGPDKYPEQYNQYGDILLNSRIEQSSSGGGGDWNVWAKICQYMPNTTEALMASIRMRDTPGCEGRSLLLRQYQQEHPDPVTQQSMSAFVADNGNLLDGDGAFEGFINDVTLDNAVLSNTVFTGQTTGLLIPYFNQAIATIEDKSPFMNFMDNWSVARGLLERTNDAPTLLDVAYSKDAAGLIDNYISSTGNTTIVSRSIAAIPTLSLDGFISNIYRLPQLYCLTTVVIDSIVHVTYQQAVTTRRFWLAEHDLYGSNRLGNKTYLPGQFYSYYDFTGPTPVKDTASLTSARPWYSLEYNDLITGLALAPYSLADFGRYYASHNIGQKQYELTNHLGNVQATVSDLPYPRLIDNIVLGYSPAMPAAYDYYPFGMLMPGRYVSDTSSQCMTLTQTKWVTTWVDSCYDVYKWVWPQLQVLNDAVVSVSGAVLDFNLPRVNSEVRFEFSSVANLQQQVSFDIAEVTTGSGLVSILENRNGVEYTLASTSLVKGRSDLIFTTTENKFQIRILGPVRVKVNTVCVKRPQQTQQSMLVDVCNDSKDRYRFGFNGQEKVNEWSGVGNHNTALFWEYDTRTGRRLNLDPEFKRKPNQSVYATNSGNPIMFNDPLGNLESTHTDNDGNVIAVYDDGDNGVYVHGNNADGNAPTQYQIDKRHDKYGTSANGKKVGETWTPLGFADFGKYEADPTEIVPGKGAKIDFKSYWASNKFEDIIDDNPMLGVYIFKAKTNGDYDFKTKVPQGQTVYYGSMLNGKYASARDVGNMAAGFVAQRSIAPTKFSEYGFGKYNQTGNSLLKTAWEVYGDVADMFSPDGSGHAQERGMKSANFTLDHGEDELSRQGIKMGINVFKLWERGEFINLD